MSDWKRYFEPAVLQVLASAEFSALPHHFGRPFVSAYQLAVAVERTYPELCERHGMVVGVGPRSLEWYLARQLSGGCKNDPDYPVEGAWLSAAGLTQLTYVYDGRLIEASSNAEHHAYSMFRLKQG